jgi:hemoglobin
MHPDDIETSIDKLARFLCGWLGGPKRYQEKYDSINIPAVHQHLAIGIAERDQWLICMKESIDEQAYETDFKEYLISQLGIPAEIVRQRCNQ